MGRFEQLGHGRRIKRATTNNPQPIHPTPSENLQQGLPTPSENPQRAPNNAFISLLPSVKTLSNGKSIDNPNQEKSIDNPNQENKSNAFNELLKEFYDDQIQIFKTQQDSPKQQRQSPQQTTHSPKQMPNTKHRSDDNNKPDKIEIQPINEIPITPIHTMTDNRVDLESSNQTTKYPIPFNKEQASIPRKAYTQDNLFLYALNFALSITTSSKYVWIKQKQQIATNHQIPEVLRNNSKIKLVYQSLSNHFQNSTVNTDLNSFENKIYDNLMNSYQNLTEKSEFSDLKSCVENLCSLYNIRSFGLNEKSAITFKMVEIFIMKDDNKHINRLHLDFKEKNGAIQHNYEFAWAICKDENDKYFLIVRDPINMILTTISVNNSIVVNDNLAYHVVLIAYKSKIKTYE